MPQLRILQIAHDHPDWTNGGTEIVARDLARAINVQPDVSARFLAAATRLQRPEAIPGSLQAFGEDFVIVTGAYDRFTMLRQDGSDWVTALGKVLDVVRPDVVHLHGIDRIGAEVVYAIRRLAPDCRIILTLHDYQLICTNDGLMLTNEGQLCTGASPDRCRRCVPAISATRHALRKAHLMAILAQVDQIIAPSVFLRDVFVKWGLASDRITLIANGVKAAPPLSPRERRPKRQRNRFAFFGNISRHKGVLVLLQAAARLASGTETLRIDLHGGLGWADETFRTEFAAGLRDAATVAQHLGPYSRSDVSRLMRNYDWVVVPSLWWENAPLVILEAQAAGIPVICSGVGGMAELVTDGRTGLHVPPGDAASLAETLREAAGDETLWARLAASAYAPLHAAHVDQHLSLYRKLARVSA